MNKLKEAVAKAKKTEAFNSPSEVEALAKDFISKFDQPVYLINAFQFMGRQLSERGVFPRAFEQIVSSLQSGYKAYLNTQRNKS